jgi:hypothetical protein
VQIEIKRCTHGHFVVYAKIPGTGKRGTGKFKVFSRAAHGGRRLTYYEARAVINGKRSGKVHFAVVH